VLPELTKEAAKESMMEVLRINARRASIEAMQELVQAVVVANGILQAKFLLAEKFRGQVVVDHPELKIPVACQVDCRPTEDGDSDEWYCLYQLEAPSLINPEMLVDLENDVCYDALQMVMEKEYHLALEDVLDQFTDKEQHAVDDGEAVISACARIIQVTKDQKVRGTLIIC